MAWNLSGLIVTSFFANQPMTILLSDFNVPLVWKVFLPNQMWYYHQQIMHRGYLDEEK